MPRCQKVPVQCPNSFLDLALFLQNILQDSLHQVRQTMHLGKNPLHPRQLWRLHRFQGQVAHSHEPSMDVAIAECVRRRDLARLSRSLRNKRKICSVNLISTVNDVNFCLICKHEWNQSTCFTCTQMPTHTCIHRSTIIAVYHHLNER